MSVFASFDSQGGSKPNCGLSSTSRLSRPLPILVGARPSTNIHAGCGKSKRLPEKISGKFPGFISMKKSVAGFLNPLFYRGGNGLIVCAIKSNFERVPLLRFFRRRLQPARQALRARAQAAQIFECINPGVVTVAPPEAEGIVAHGSDAHPLQPGGNLSGKDLADAGHFIHTGSAHAIFP